MKTIWIARNKTGSLKAFIGEPKPSSNFDGIWSASDDGIISDFVSNDDFQEITWESGAVEMKLVKKSKFTVTCINCEAVLSHLMKAYGFP